MALPGSLVNLSDNALLKARSQGSKREVKKKNEARQKSMYKMVRYEVDTASPKA